MSEYYTSTQVVRPEQVEGQLQTIYDNAAPNTRIYLPDGAYRLPASFRLRGSKQLVGAGPHRCVLVMADPMGIAIRADDQDDWLLQGVAIQGSRQAGQTQSPNAGIHAFGGRRGTIRDVAVNNVGGMGIEAGGTDGLTIEDCTIDNVGLHGLWLGWRAANQTEYFAKGTRVLRTKVSNVDLDAIEVHRDTYFEDVTVSWHGKNYVSADPIATAGGFYVMECPGTPAYNVRFERCRSEYGRGAGWDISDAAHDITMNDAVAYSNGGCGFSIAGNHCTLTNFRAFGNGGTPTSPLRAGVVLGSQQGAQACNTNLIQNGIIEYNMLSAIYLAGWQTFSAYGSVPRNNLLLDIYHYGNAGVVRNADPSAPNVFRLYP